MPRIKPLAALPVNFAMTNEPPRRTANPFRRHAAHAVCVDGASSPRPLHVCRCGVPLLSGRQAPGPVERIAPPASGRAGGARPVDALVPGSPARRVRRSPIAALMRCFPMQLTGSGDPGAPPAAVANARTGSMQSFHPRPKVHILVGSSRSHASTGPAAGDRVGHRFDERPMMIPLPHPSGQGRWRPTRPTGSAWPRR
jgi:hypothetical protein